MGGIGVYSLDLQENSPPPCQKEQVALIDSSLGQQTLASSGRQRTKIHREAALLAGKNIMARRSLA